MARDYHRWTDQFPTITLLLSATVDVAGETWRGVIPLAGLALDHRPGQDALVGFVLAAGFGGTSGAPAGVLVRLLANTHLADHAVDFDPRQVAWGSVTIEVQVASTAAAFEDVPLVLYVLGVASDAPDVADIELPTLITNSTNWTVKDIQGGAVGSHWVEVT